MTQQDDITQRVLTDDEIRGEIHNAIGFGFEPGELQSVNAADLMNVAYALLSKLRAPVADERAAVDPCGYVAVKVAAVDWLKDKFPALTIKAGLCERIGGRLYTITRLMRDHDAALASAPVAGEARPVARIDNFGNVVMLTSDAPLNSYLYAAPQASAEVQPNAEIVALAREGVRVNKPGTPEYQICAELRRLARALKQPRAGQGERDE